LAEQKPIAGIVDFRERMLPQYAQRFKELALSQAPDALVREFAGVLIPDTLGSRGVVHKRDAV
jgi:carbonic anhydrase